MTNLKKKSLCPRDPQFYVSLREMTKRRRDVGGDVAAGLREGVLLLVLAVLAVVAGPALARIAPRGAGLVHARRDVLAGVQLAHVHTLPSEVPCRDRSALSPPQNLPTTPHAPLRARASRLGRLSHLCLPQTPLPVLCPHRGPGWRRAESRDTPTFGGSDLEGAGKRCGGGRPGLPRSHGGWVLGAYDLSTSKSRQPLEV